MVGLKRPRKQSTSKTAERQPQPTIPEMPLVVSLPQDTELLAAKKPKITKNAGTRIEATVASDGHNLVQVQEDAQVRSKMADPTPAREGEQTNMAPSTSSTKEAPCGTIDLQPPTTSITTAQAHVPAEPRPERTEPICERADGNQLQREDTMADSNEDEAQVFSQESQRQMLEMLKERKRDNCERLAAIGHEMETIRKRIRELEAERAEVERMLAIQANIINYDDGNYGL